MNLIKKRPNILIFSAIVCLLSSVQSLDLDLEQTANPDGFFYILFKVLLNELVDKAFWTAILLGFIYGPAFANTAYLCGSFLTVLAASLFGVIFDIIPDLLINMVVAFAYLVFGWHSFIFIHDEKEKGEGDYQEVPDVLEDKAKGKEKGDEEEKIGFVEKMEKDVQKKMAEAAASDVKAQASGVINSLGKNENKDRGFFATVFNFKFMSSKKIRFVCAALLYFLAALNSKAFKAIWTLRKTNSFLWVFFICLLVYMLCGVIVVILGYVMKRKIYKNYVKTRENINIVKSIACALMILIAFMQLFS